MHLVRFGTAADTRILLFEFETFNESKEYRDTQIANGKKSKEELASTCKRVQPRPWRQYRDEDERQYVEAKEEHEAPCVVQPA